MTLFYLCAWWLLIDPKGIKRIRFQRVCGESQAFSITTNISHYSSTIYYGTASKGKKHHLTYSNVFLNFVGNHFVHATGMISETLQYIQSHASFLIGDGLL